MNVLDIVKAYLEANGYDGLYNEWGECACLVSDLAPCALISTDCAAGMKGPCDCGDHDWHIVAREAAGGGDTANTVDRPYTREDF